MNTGNDPKELLAAINATLNASSGILLILGYWMIKKRRIRTHATLMIGALCTSAIFLACYLYSHYRYGERSSQLQPGPLRTFYFVLLISHILLAVGMLPPILMTVWRAYTRQWARHAKLARPTFWVWVYVSGTGVIVYWMLYHLFPSLAVATVR